MYEIMFIASSLRLPIVMAIATRALSAPINIWNDHSDFMAASDTGWLMMMAHNNQEAHDDILLAFKVAEDPRVLLPVATGIDGYLMSHTIEPVEVVDRDEALSFIPKKITWKILNPEDPVTIGSLATPEWYFEFKKQQYEAAKIARQVYEEAAKKFHSEFGRYYPPVEEYELDDAEIALVAMGSVAGTIKAFIKKARKRGVKLGLLRVKLLRPFPADLIAKALANVEIVGVIDKALVPGHAHGGPLFSEVLTAMMLHGNESKTVGFIAGLGGRMIKFSDIDEMVNILTKYKGVKELPKEPFFIGVRE
jgi:pyruvate ferredoxin oxidoreductase alpha subunit